MPWAVRLDTSTFSLNNKGTRGVYEFTPNTRQASGRRQKRSSMARHVGEARSRVSGAEPPVWPGFILQFESAGREEFNAFAQQMCAELVVLCLRPEGHQAEGRLLSRS